MLKYGDREEYPSSSPERSQKVGRSRKNTDEEAADDGGGGDEAGEDLFHDFGLAAEGGDLEAGVDELLGDGGGAHAGGFEPHFGEADAEDDEDGGVDEGVEGFGEDLLRAAGGADEVGEAAFGAPFVVEGAEEADEEVVPPAVVEHFGDEEDVGEDGGGEDDGDVGDVEEFDGVFTAKAAVAGVLDGDFDAHGFEVDDDEEDGDGSEDAEDVRGASGADEGGADGAGAEEGLEKGNDGAVVKGVGRGLDEGEGVPHDLLGDASGDEEGDAGAKAPAFLDHFVEEDDDEAGGDELSEDEDDLVEAEVAVGAAEDVGEGFEDGHKDGEDLLDTGVEGAVFGVGHVDVNDFGADEDLHDEAGGDDGADAEFGEGAAGGGHDGADPVEGVGAALLDFDAIDGDGGHDEVGDEGEEGVDEFPVEGDFDLGFFDFGDEAHEGFEGAEEGRGHGRSTPSRR